jgi:hypothetical protein
MPKSTPKKLAYQAAYNRQPDQKEAGVERRRARRQAIREGKVAIGDGKDLAHKVAMDNGGSTTDANLKVQSAKKNRAWRRNSGYKVPNSK